MRNTIWIRRALTLASLTLMAISASTGAHAQSLKKFVVDPHAVAGGANAHGWALLDAKAPDGGATITLGSDQSFAAVPATVTVPAGESGVTFTITTSAVTADSPANITATDSSSKSLSASLTVKAPIVVALKDAAIFPQKVQSGKASHGGVRLSAPAPAGGFAVNLSFDQTFAHAPASVTVAQGKREAYFDITTDAGNTGDTNLTASDGAGNQATAKLTLYQFTLGLRGLEIHPDHVNAGNSAKGHVQLNGKAPDGGLAITLSSDQSFAHPDATVTVPAGKESADFNIATDAGANGDANISASDGTKTLSAKLHVATNTVGIKFVGSGDGPYTGGSKIHAFVVLTGKAPAGGELINLASDNAALQAPASVTVPEGAVYVTFDLTSSPVTAKTVATLSATDPNSKTATNKVTLLPLGLAGFKVTTEHVIGGSNATAVLYLSGPAPDGGLTFSLSSDSTSAQPPATATVPAGAKFVLVTIPTGAVTAPTKVTLTATDGSGNSKTATLWIVVAKRA